jgi:mannose-6-phosphate isomerase-like protein (cupin superfamily)
MAIEFADMNELAQNEKRRKVLINTSRFHAWFHYYPNPGDKDDMHCHNQDQSFYVIDGECTMHFPDGTKKVLKPNMAALITGGSFYQLENSGTGPMVMMGNRSGSVEETQTIDYHTRKPIRPRVRSRG